MRYIRKITIAVYIGLCLLLFFSCRKTSKFPNRPVELFGTKIVAHHAYIAPADSVTNDSILDNAFLKCDGIEVDVELSQDLTLWLFHDDVMSSCGNIKSECLMSKNDQEIADLAKCQGNGVLYLQLEDLFRYVKRRKFKGRISLDIKSWFGSPCSTYKNNMLAYYYNEAVSIVRLVKQYDLEKQVMVESEVVYFLDKIVRRSSIESYLATFGDFDEGSRKALKYGYTGISFQFMYKDIIDSNDIAFIHQKGLRIQLWVVNGDSMINVAKQMRPDYIQTDTY